MESPSRSRAPFLLVILAMLVGLAVCAAPAEADSGEFYKWAKWRLGHEPYSCQAGAPWVRPNVRMSVPASWWNRLEGYRAVECPPTSEPPEEEPVDTTVTQVTLDGREEALRDAVNAERSRHGLPALILNPGLQRAARGHTVNMSRFRYFGHDWNDGTPYRTWVNRYTGCHLAGEILAWRSPRQTPSNAVRQWLASPGHRAALLSGSWSVMGVALTQRYATVEFGRRC